MDEICIKECPEYIKKIPKQDFGIEWLKQNCECSKLKCSGRYKENIKNVEITKEEYEKYRFNYLIYDGLLVCGGSAYPWGNYYSFDLEKDPGCEEYSCSDKYTVEFIK